MMRCEWNMPEGATTEQYDRYMGYDQPDDEEPEDADDDNLQGVPGEPPPDV